MTEGSSVSILLGYGHHHLEGGVPGGVMLFGNGDGTVQSAVNFVVGDGPTSLAIDGIVDPLDTGFVLSLFGPCP